MGREFQAPNMYKIKAWGPGGKGEKEVKERADEIGANGGDEGSETSVRSLGRHRGSQSLQEPKMQDTVAREGYCGF